MLRTLKVDTDRLSSPSGIELFLRDMDDMVTAGHELKERFLLISMLEMELEHRL